MIAQFLLHFVTAMVLLAHQSECVVLGEEESKILLQIIQEFKNSPLDPKYDHVIHLPIDKAHLVPKVFIWCPISHYQVTLRCPIDNNPLKIQSFAKSVPSSKAKERAPRLIYDIGGNILLVQTYYVCIKDNKERRHTYMSATSEIMEKLPGNIAKRFPFVLHYKSGFSKDILDFLIVSLSQGHKFLEMTEMLASLNFHKFVERNQLAGVPEVAKGFPDNILYSSSSGDKLMHVFLWDFERKSELYKSHLSSIPCTTLVCDHSYKMEKKCKVKGSGNGSGKNMHLENLFLGLNENGEVVLWKPVNSKHFHEIKDALIEFKERLEANGEELNAILVSDCCASRAMYQQIFPTVPVKMGIVHAITSVTDTLPKEHPDTMVFAHKLIQIFSSSPLEEQRTEETISPLEIEANLDFLLTNWRSRLSEPTMLALDTLRYHIRRGCLSGIPPGDGTEKVDALHRYIQKSFLGRVTVITPDMAFAIFTCLLYAWNCKKLCKNLFKGKKVIPVMPIEAHDVKPKTSPDQSKIDVKGLTDEKGVEPLVIQCSQQTEGGATVSSMLVITADVLEYMFIRLLHIQDLITSFKEKCQKSFGMSDFPVFSSNGGISSYEKLIPESSEQEKNIEVLKNNLAEYGLQLDKVPGDGNCLFRSIVLQVQKLTQTSPELQKHLKVLGLGLSQQEDTTKLRELFVEELKNNFAGYKDWINLTTINLEQDLRNFSENGFFASDIGDLCIKVCANILQVPIIVIPSLQNVKFLPFLPTKFCTGSPVYVAYNHSAPGHYDGTEEIPIPDPSKNKCKCGRKNKYASKESEVTKMSCDPNDTKCPCAAANLPCVFCQCYNCQNKPTVGTRLSCKCNSRGKRSSEIAACLNKGRATCCCAKAGLSCTANCFCRCCGNGKPQEEPEENTEEETPRRRIRKGINRKPGEIKEDPDVPSPTSEWTEQELICLMVCKEVLAACNVEQNVHNISQVFQYIAKSKNNADLGLSISVKHDSAIENKLQFLHIGTPVVTQFVTMTTSTITASI